MANLKPWPQYIGGYNKERSIQIDNQRTLNMYIIKDKESPEQQAFAMMPGLSYDTKVGDGDDITRPLGLFAFEGSRYHATSDKLFKENAFIGYLNTSNGPVSWSSLETQVVLCDGSTIYVYDTVTLTYTTVSQAFIKNPGRITAFNQIIIVPLKNDNVWYASAINDAKTFDANRFNVFQLKPDTLMGSATINNRLLLFGKIHTECYIPQVTASIPVVRDNNVVIDFGTWSDSSIVVTTEEQGVKFITWLARDELGGAFFMLTEGIQSSKISTPSIDILLQSFSHLEDCYGFSHRTDGHLFIEWSFPTDNYTIVYDATVKEWTMRAQLDDSYWIGNSHAYVNGIHWVGSRKDNSLYKMSSNYLTYYSSGQTTENIHRQRISPILRNPKQTKFTVSYKELKMEMGTAPVGITPYVYLQCSRNNNAWDSARPFNMGEIGHYGDKVYWYGLGTQYSLITKIDMYAPVRTFIMGASLIMSEGMR